LSRALRRSLADQQYDVIHVEHLRGVPYGLLLLDQLPRAQGRHVPVVWDSVDCISDLFRHAARSGPTPLVRWAARLELPRTERYEGTVATRFDRVLTTSETDRLGLLSLAERAGTARPDLRRRIVVLPNGVEFDDHPPGDTDRDPATLVMTGKMSYHANVSAVVAFATTVLPRIQAQRHDTRLLIVGRDPTPAVKALARLPGVTVTGTVVDVRPFLRRAAIAVAPIQYGVGIQNKVLEAMASATPVVATPAAVAALDIVDGSDVAVASDPESMAARILDLLDDPRKRARLGAAGRRYVEANHDWPSIARRLTETYLDAR
jgi:glycosyltransferase involved in cell wall biosynthesis